MPRMCALCGKKKQMGNTKKMLRSHFNVTGRRAFKPNLQTIKHEGERILACVQCIRTLTKKQAAKTKTK